MGSTGNKTTKTDISNEAAVSILDNVHKLITKQNIFVNFVNNFTIYFIMKIVQVVHTEERRRRKEKKQTNEQT